MGLGKFLSRVLDAITTRRDFDPEFPPLVHCPICAERTFWLERSKKWGCKRGHYFDVHDPKIQHFPPPPDPMRDGRIDGEI